MSSLTSIRIYMGGLILGITTWYRLFCFFKLLPMVGKGLMDQHVQKRILSCKRLTAIPALPSGELPSASLGPFTLDVGRTIRFVSRWNCCTSASVTSLWQESAWVPTTSLRVSESPPTVREI